jgi:SAM-dependent methyltransferase
MTAERSAHILYQLPSINRSYAEIRTKAIVDLIERLTEGGDRLEILDVACGRGELLRALSQKGYAATGIDFDKNCVAIASKHGNCRVGDAYKIEEYFGDNSFDLVICSHFLEHTEAPKQYVEKLKKLTRRYLLLVVPNLAQFITIEHSRPQYATRGHLCGWDPSHFKTFLELHCDIDIKAWTADQVIIPGRPLWMKVPVLRTLLRYAEIKLLVKLFPYVSNSLIVLCEKR